LIDSNTYVKICIISSVPITLRSFYSALIKKSEEHNFEATLVSSHPEKLRQLGEELGCKTFSVCIGRQISPFRDLVSICKLARYLHKQKFDIIHAHTPKGGFIGMISAWLAHIPNRVYTVHGLVSETAGGIRRRLLWLTEWLSCKSATFVLAVSPSLKHRIIEEGICPSGKIEVLGSGSACGIDLAKFSRQDDFLSLRAKLRTKYGIPDDAIVIGYIGRIVPDKGITTLVEAFEKVQKKKAGTYLLLVGNIDNVRDSLDDKTLDKLNSDPHIIFDNEFVRDVVPFYAAMDIMTLPSRREGFGLTLIEASALGLPVIATKVTGCVDAVVDGRTGLLVDVDDAEQLSDAINYLLENPNLRSELGKNGSERAAKLFDSNELVHRHMDFYRNILKPRPPL
jgi:glycosyltransferase involved in cell wall biosynthesis